MCLRDRDRASQHAKIGELGKRMKQTRYPQSVGEGTGLSSSQCTKLVTFSSQMPRLFIISAVFYA